MKLQWMASMESFAPLVLPVLNALNPRVIAEIGAAEGTHTRLLYEFLKNRQGTLVTMDPAPRGSFVEWVQSTQGVVKHIPDYSLNAIPNAGAVDAWFVDGDHNWYTVFNELRLIHELAQAHQKPAVIFMHDVSWPCARRDMYYDPKTIPAEFLQPNSNELGVTFEAAASPLGGLKGPHWALQEGGTRNGVLTAVEDFLKTVPQTYQWFHVPVVLGLGLLVDQRHPLANAIAEFYRPYHNNPLLDLVERDRVKNYIANTQLVAKLEKISQVVA